MEGNCLLFKFLFEIGKKKGTISNETEFPAVIGSIVKPDLFNTFIKTPGAYSVFK